LYEFNNSTSLKLGESEHYTFLIPLLAALIGWITNFIAVKMLFHPQKPLQFLGMTIQGVFPKRQKALAIKLGDLVANELFRMEDVAAKIQSFSTSKKNTDAIGKRIEKTIRGKLIETFPMLSMFLSDDMIEKVTHLFRAELEEFITDSTAQLTKDLENNLNVSQMVRSKVSDFSSEKLERILVSLMKKEFKFIEIIGAILGFLIGCVQVVLTLLIS
tara:strand:- start:1167 stop:1814 length:648 start_codon:yes stop_codon:yes gene_type:complete